MNDGILSKLFTLYSLTEMHIAKTEARAISCHYGKARVLVKQFSRLLAAGTLLLQKAVKSSCASVIKKSCRMIGLA
jgi:hypothetical protein